LRAFLPGGRPGVDFLGGGVNGPTPARHASCAKGRGRKKKTETRSWGPLSEALRGVKIGEAGTRVQCRFSTNGIVH